MFFPSDYFRQRVAMIESGGNNDAQNPNSSAAGKYQFTASTAKQYGLTDPTDEAQATAAFDRFTADNHSYLKKKLGREPTDAELYLAHQQGAAGAAKLIRNPDLKASDVVGTKQIALNGGNPDMTAADFTSMWENKFNGGKDVQPSNDTKAIMAGMNQARQQPAQMTADSGQIQSDANPVDYGYGYRADGSPKGNGWLGMLKRPDGNMSSELSVGVEIDGKETEIPILVPTLTKDEVQTILSNKPGDIPGSVMDKAVSFAKQRISQGKSPFASPSESPDGSNVMTPQNSRDVIGAQQQQPAHSKIDLMLEAERRGILPPDRKALLDEARARGLVPKLDNQPAQEPGFTDRVKADLAQRQANNDLSAQEYLKGNQTLGEGVLQGIGQGAGFANDVAGEAFKSVGSGINSLTGGYAGKAATNVLNSLADTRVGRDVAGAAREVSSAYSQLQKDSPRTARNVGAIANIGLLGLSAPGVEGANAIAPAVGTAAAGVGRATSGAAKTAGKAVVTAGERAIAPSIDTATAELAQRARDLGVPLRGDQIAPTRVRNTVQKVSQEIPLNGNDAFEQAQRKAFTGAVAKTIGQTGDLGPETINKFISDSKQKFSSAIGGGNFKVTNDDFDKIAKIEGELPKQVTDDIANIVRQHTNQFRNDLTAVSKTKTVPAGVDDFGQPKTKTVTQKQSPIIPAKKLSSLRSDLIQSLPKIDSQARPHVAELIDVIDGIAERNITAQQAEKLQQVRREWRNFKTIEPLLEKSTDGQINPTQLLEKVASSKYIKASRSEAGKDDLVDLARIGKEFMAKKGGSDTAQKAALFTAGGLATASLVNPLIALKAGAGIAGNRAFQSLNRSQSLIDLAIKHAK